MLKYLHYNNLFYIGIKLKLCIDSLQKRCCYYDFKINKIIIQSNNDSIIIRKNLKKILDWDLINRYSPNCKYIDIEYYYNNKLYNIQFEKNQVIDFPLSFDKKKLISNKFIGTNYELLDNMFSKYAGPLKDFYQSNNINMKFKNICEINKIDYSNLILTNSKLEDKHFSDNDIIKM